MSSLPDGWQCKRIGEIAAVSSGGTPSRQNDGYWDGRIPWIATSSINFNLILQADQYITDDGLAKSSARLLPINTILMAMYGQGMTRGRVAILGIEATTNQACAAIQVFPEFCYRYVYHCLANQYLRIRELGHGGNQKNLNQSLVESISIFVPPLLEQLKIAEILDFWDQAIAAVEHLIAALQRRKKGLMQRLLTGQVRFPEFTNAPWEDFEIGDYLKPVTRAERVIAGKDYRLIGVRWYLAGAHIHDVVPGNKMVTQTLSRVEENDIVYNKMWVSKAAFAVAKKEHHGAYGSGEYPQFVANGSLDVHFMEYAFHDPRFLHDAKALCRGTTGRIRLHPDDFLRLRMRLPSMAEQSKIAAALQVADQEIDSMKLYEDGLRSQKKGLMQRLLTGQVRVHV